MCTNRCSYDVQSGVKTTEKVCNYDSVISNRLLKSEKEKFGENIKKIEFLPDFERTNICQKCMS